MMASKGHAVNLLSLCLGSIPSTLYTLTALTNLNIGGNAFASSITSAIGSLVRLSSLSIGANSLAGSLPSSIALMTALTSLVVSSNALLTGLCICDCAVILRMTMTVRVLGTLPTSLFTMTALRSVNIVSNGIAGASNFGFSTIAVTQSSHHYYHVTMLHRIHRFIHWQFNGAIYAYHEQQQIFGFDYFHIAFPTLRCSDSYDIIPVGSIPSAIGGLTGLTAMALYGNKMTGENI